MRRGFTLLEVLLAAVILGVGLAGILVSMSQAQRMMLSATDLDTVQEVMDLGEMAYPLDMVEKEDDLEVRETKATELWSKISDERLTQTQEDKFHGFTWEREVLNKNDKSEDIERLGNLYIVRITVTWGGRGKGSGFKQQESYVTFWRKPDE